MPVSKYQEKHLPAAWQDIDKISDFHPKMVGPASAEIITGNIPDTLSKLSSFPYMGTQHPDPELARLEHRNATCGDHVRVYKIMFTSRQRQDGLSPLVEIAEQF